MKSTDPSTHVIYSDRLVEITAEGISFRHYYIFTSSAKFVPFSGIDHINARKPTIYSGKWRIGGTGSPGIWFPLDWHRPSRDRIFRASLKNGKAIGFTVEDSVRVITILQGLGLFGSDDSGM